MLLDTHKILVPPNIKGKIKNIALEGNYNLKDVIIELELNG